MSWRKLLGVEDSTDNPYTHNTHNAGKSSVQDNSAYIADSAYRVEIEKCRDNLIANHKVTSDSIYPALIKKGGSTRAMTATPATHSADDHVSGAVALEPELLPKLSPSEESNIRAWLAHIEEADLVIIHEILEMCRADLKHRQYFLKRSEEVLLGAQK